MHSSPPTRGVQNFLDLSFRNVLSPVEKVFAHLTNIDETEKWLGGASAKLLWVPISRKEAIASFTNLIVVHFHSLLCLVILLVDSTFALLKIT